MLGCIVNGLAEITFEQRFKGASPLEHVIAHLEHVRQNVSPLISLLAASGGSGGGSGLNLGSLLLAKPNSVSSDGGGLNLGSLLMLASPPKPANAVEPTETSSNPAAALGLAALF